MDEIMDKAFVSFDGIKKPDGVSLYSGYMRHMNGKFVKKDSSRVPADPAGGRRQISAARDRGGSRNQESGLVSNSISTL